MMQVNMNGLRANMADEFNQLSKQIEELRYLIGQDRFNELVDSALELRASISILLCIYSKNLPDFDKLSDVDLHRIEGEIDV